MAVTERGRRPVTRTEGCDRQPAFRDGVGGGLACRPHRVRGEGRAHGHPPERPAARRSRDEHRRVASAAVRVVRVRQPAHRADDGPDAPRRRHPEGDRGPLPGLRSCCSLRSRLHMAAAACGRLTQRGVRPPTCACREQVAIRSACCREPERNIARCTRSRRPRTRRYGASCLIGAAATKRARAEAAGSKSPAAAPPSRVLVATDCLSQNPGVAHDRDQQAQLERLLDQARALFAAWLAANGRAATYAVQRVKITPNGRSWDAQTVNVEVPTASLNLGSWGSGLAGE